MQHDSDIERDAELMRRVKEGNGQAFRDLSELYLKRVVSYAFRLLGNRAEAEEVTQDAFLKLWQGAEKWQPRARVHTWLYRVCYHASIDRLRRRKGAAEADPDAVADSQAPSGLLRRRQTAEAVRRAMLELPERQLRALELSHFEGLGNAEIADVLDVGVEAVESLLARGRRRLKEVLGEYRGE